MSTILLERRKAASTRQHKVQDLISRDLGAAPAETWAHDEVHEQRQNISLDDETARLLSVTLSQTPISAFTTLVDTPKRCSNFNFYGTDLGLDDISLGTTEKNNYRHIMRPLAPGDEDEEEMVRFTKGRTPLHVAAQKGREKIVDILLQHGADCNARDSSDRTPLVYATIYGHKETVVRLLAHGARIHGAEDRATQRTPLHWAVLYQQEGVLRTLLDHCGPDDPIINKADSMGRAPVHIAVESNFDKGLRLLLQVGADVDLRMSKDT